MSGRIWPGKAKYLVGIKDNNFIKIETHKVEFLL